MAPFGTGPFGSLPYGMVPLPISKFHFNRRYLYRTKNAKYRGYSKLSLKTSKYYFEFKL